MQAYDEQQEETTYVAQAAAQDFSMASAGIIPAQHVVDEDRQPSDISKQIYSYATLVADRTREARQEKLSQTNDSMTKVATS